MSGHPDLRPLIDGNVIPSAARREILAHVAGCAACRATLAEADPSLLFTVLALEPVPAAVLERVTERATAAIDRERRRAGWPRTVRRALLAASLLVAALSGAYFLGTGGRPMAPREGPTATAAVRSPQPESAIPAGMIELIESRGDSPEVVEMAVGDVDVVMIFDEAMGI